MSETEDQFTQAVETALEEQAAALTALGGRIDQLERVILWMAKQPFELDSGFTWNQLVEKVEAGDPKPLRFKDTAAPPVRDLL